MFAPKKMEESIESNGIGVTQRQHEAIHAPFLAALGSSDTLIGRMELFLNEMDRRAEVGQVSRTAADHAATFAANRRPVIGEVAHA